jgi:multidrug efflux pump subunit AcrB
MKNLIEYFVQRSLLVNLITLMIIVAGVFSALTLNRETFPNVDFDWITVRYVYPGSSAEDVEKLVSIPVERKMKEVDGIDELYAMSGEAFSIFSLKVNANYHVDDVLEEVRNTINNVSDIPPEIDPPVVRKLANKQRPLIKISLMGIEERELRTQAKNLRDRLELLPGIARVNLEGFRDQAFMIEVDPNKLIQYELTMSDLSNAIKDRHISLSAGSIKTKKEEIVIRTQNEFEKVSDIENIVVRTNSLGNSVFVKDLAKVMLTFKDIVRIDRVNQKESIILDIVGLENANVITTTDKVKKVAQDFIDESLNKDLQYEVVDEMAFFVKRRLGILSQNGMYGTILVFICLMVFLNIKVAILTTSGAFLAFMVAFGVMDVLGLTINLISMLALIMVLGMLVDDSIIVAEQFYQNLEKGQSSLKASINAAFTTIAPVTATILTTIVAFGSLLFMGGIMGKFLWPVPAVVIICLIASWIECFFILPNHLADFVRAKDQIKNKEERWYTPLLNLYEASLKIFLKFKYITIFSFVLLFFVALYVAHPKNKIMKFELFPADDVTQLNVRIKGQVGTPFDQTYSELEKIEQIIVDNFDKIVIKAMRTTIGFQRLDDGISRTGNQYGQIKLFLTEQTEREITPNQILGKISPLIKETLSKGFDFAVEKQRQGPPRGKAFKVEVKGDDLNELLTFSKRLRDHAGNLKGVMKSEIDFEEGKKQLLVKVKEQEARRLGLSNRQIAMELRRSIEGEEIVKVRKSDEDIEVILRLNEDSRKDLNILEKLYISNSLGRRIKLTSVADITYEPVSFVIRRFNRKRTIAVSGEIDRKLTSAFEVNQAMKTFLNDELKNKKHIQYEFKGENADTQDSVTRLGKAGIISMFLIFIILVTMFSSLVQPLIVMSSIPFGLIGVIGIFFVLQVPLGFMALMGVIGLIGVVVNDSIVLVNTINININENPNENVLNVVKSACLSRFRPVLLTTITTVAGLLPVAHATGGDPFLKPMALSFAYGLLFSTSLTLVFIPACYLIYKDFKLFRRKVLIN